ncbi:MAG: IS30 family transposase [Bacteroidota bacterium]
MKTRTYCQLSAEERDTIAYKYTQGASLSEIAGALGRNKSTISRELRRNKAPIYSIYLANRAQQRSTARKSQAHRRPRLKRDRIRRYVRSKLMIGWSPEQIAGRLPIHHPGFSISHEAIYQYLYDRNVRRQEDLVPFLARAHKRRQVKGHRHTHRSLHIPERTSITERPSHVLQRKQLGHWEADAVFARRSISGLQVVVERKTRFTKLIKLKERSARQVRCALTRTLRPYPPAARRTITYDNGSENVLHQQVNALLGTRSYFCTPFHSWEKGTVENTIGLLRRVFPKKTNFDTVSRIAIKLLERRLNNRPRKVLHYKTPREKFNCCVALTR